MLTCIQLLSLSCAGMPLEIAYHELEIVHINQLLPIQPLNALAELGYTQLPFLLDKYVPDH